MEPVIIIQGITLDQFKNWLRQIISEELIPTVESYKLERYLSPKQVSEMLGVDLSTLWRWNKKGYLIHIEIGGKRRYKMSDINKLLKNEHS